MNSNTVSKTGFEMPADVAEAVTQPFTDTVYPEGHIVRKYQPVDDRGFNVVADFRFPYAPHQWLRVWYSGFCFIEDKPMAQSEPVRAVLLGSCSYFDEPFTDKDLIAKLLAERPHLRACAFQN